MPRRPRAPLAPWRIALTGMVALGVAMGIGRFAFTPLLPMMLADGVVDIGTASWLASANYLGYLVGALLCMVMPWLWRRAGRPAPPNAPVMVRVGLAATTVLTLGMALQWPGLWPAMRFAAGVASALVFVYVSGWCLGQLALLGVPSLGATIYMGPGAGIALSGLAASGMVALHGKAATGWLVFGVLAAALSALVWGTLHPRRDLHAPSPEPKAQGNQAPERVPSSAQHGEITLLATAYLAAGFGYIITATFLPVIARQQLARSVWLDLFWPIFGVGVMLGAFLASRLRNTGDMRLRLAACYAVQALGIGVGLVEVSVAGFAIGSLLLGLPFTVISYYTMQEARRLRPVQPASLMGMLTAIYGLGQIIGPPMTAAVLARSSSAAGGFTLALEIAATALLAGGVVMALLPRLYPLKYQ